jgi:hypothetical protein
VEYHAGLDPPSGWACSDGERRHPSFMIKLFSYLILAISHPSRIRIVLSPLCSE